MKRSREDVNNGSYIISFGVAWDKLVFAKQTIFPVYDVQSTLDTPLSPPTSPGSPELAELLNARNSRPPELKAQRGVPPPGVEFSLRATKGVNMNPPLMLKITAASPPKKIKDELGLFDESRESSQIEEEVRLSLVGPDGSSIPTGFCSCGGSPILRESRPHQFPRSSSSASSFTCAFKGDTLYFEKLQIGCCTGSRGHGTRFCLKIEFIKSDSPLCGRVALSLPIEVGSKSPFAPPPAAYADRLSPNKNMNGCEEVSNILRRINLEEYVDVFLDNEIDLEAFCKLRESDLRSMGVTKVGPCVKILNEVARVCERMVGAFPPPSPPLSLPAPPSAFSLAPTVTTTAIGTLSPSPSPVPPGALSSAPIPGSYCTISAIPGTDPQSPSFPQQLSSFLSSPPKHIPSTNVTTGSLVANMPGNMATNLALNLPSTHFPSTVAHPFSLAVPNNVQQQILQAQPLQQQPLQQQQPQQQQLPSHQLAPQNLAATLPTNLPASFLHALFAQNPNGQALWELVNPMELSALLHAQLQAYAPVSPTQTQPASSLTTLTHSTTNTAMLSNSDSNKNTNSNSNFNFTASSNSNLNNSNNNHSPSHNPFSAYSVTFSLNSENDSNSNLCNGSSASLNNLHATTASHVSVTANNSYNNSDSNNNSCNNINITPQYLFY